MPPVQLLAIIVTAVAFVPGGAHLAELPNKMKLSRDTYFTVQQIYAGWALFGIVLFAALAACLALAIMLWRLERPFLYALAAALLVALNLAIFFIWTFPHEPGDAELDGGARELGGAASAMGILARGQRGRGARRLVFAL